MVSFVFSNAQKDYRRISTERLGQSSDRSEKYFLKLSQLVPIDAQEPANELRMDENVVGQQWGHVAPVSVDPGSRFTG
jgi:hypothetical protein